MNKNTDPKGAAQDWTPEGSDRARVDGVLSEDLSLQEWLAAGGERRRWPRTAAVASDLQRPHIPDLDGR